MPQGKVGCSISQTFCLLKGKCFAKFSFFLLKTWLYQCRHPRVYSTICLFLYRLSPQNKTASPWMSKVLEVLFSDFLWYLKYLTPLFFPLKMTVKYLKIDQVLDRNQVLDTLFFFLVLFYFFTLWQSLSSTCFRKKNVKYLIKYPLFFCT